MENGKMTGKLGFGMMRLPLEEGKVDFECTKKMVDIFMKAGFTYFDTAKGYLDGQSEIAVRECVVKRYPRDTFTVTDKLSASYFESETDIRKCFESQLAACGVDYFDYYLMHAQGRGNYEKYQRCHAYEVAQSLKKEGKIRHVGLSFHDSAEFLDRILCDHPEVELVQIQFNYADYNDATVQSRKCLEVCEKHGKPVVVMEPVKGGKLVKLPSEADSLLRSLGSGSNASYAVRFAASQPAVFMVLSGMSTPDQVEDNVSYMKNFRPLDERELAAVAEAGRLVRLQNLIPCTACRYCTAGCPKKIPIPDLFADLNTLTLDPEWRAEEHTDGGKASACVACGKCEEICPQHLPVRKLLKRAARVFG